jgi:TonB family protein
MSTLEYLSENRMPAYVGVFVILLASILAYVMLHSTKPRPAPPPPVVTMVVIQPPKPPPPPPPLPQPKTIVQPKMSTPVEKPVVPNQPPKAAPPKPSAAPALGTSLKSNGTSNAFDLSGSGSGNGIIGGSGEGGGGGGSYGDAVSYQIQQALQENPVTRQASAGLVVRIWVDASGTITQVELEQSSGNPAVDDAIQNKVLNGMHLYPPPPGTGMPIEMKLTGEQPLQ